MMQPLEHEFVRVASVDEIPPGTMLDVEVGEEIVLLANVDGTIYATSAWCTHQGTALVLGKLADGAVSCWAHLWRFDVRTGEPRWPPIARVAPGYRLRTYAVRVEGEDVFVSLTAKPGTSPSP